MRLFETRRPSDCRTPVLLLLACLLICGTLSCGRSYAAATSLPFCAVQITEITEPSGQSTFRAKVCRDSEGRTRFENLGTPEGDGTPDSVRIDDPTTGTTYILFPSGNPAHQMGPWRAIPPGPWRRTLDASANRPTQDLGAKVIEGLEVHGTRVMQVGWVGSTGSVPAAGGTLDEWYAPALDVVVLQVYETSPSYKRVLRLTEIVRGEQPAELFRVPAGYTVHPLPNRRPDRT